MLCFNSLEKRACTSLSKGLSPSNVGAGWSSPVARQAHNLKVVGSNPTPATNAKAALWGGFCVYEPASFVINILDPLIYDKSLLPLRFDGIVGYLSETQQP